LLHMLELPIYIFLLGILIHFYGIKGAAFAWFTRIVLDFMLLHYNAFKSFPGLLPTILDRDNIFLAIVLVMFFSISLLLKHFISDINYLLPVWAINFLLTIIIIWKSVLNDNERTFIKTTLKSVNVKYR